VSEPSVRERALAFMEANRHRLVGVWELAEHCGAPPTTIEHGTPEELRAAMDVLWQITGLIEDGVVAEKFALVEDGAAVAWYPTVDAMLDAAIAAERAGRKVTTHTFFALPPR